MHSLAKAPERAGKGGERGGKERGGALRVEKNNNSRRQYKTSGMAIAKPKKAS